MVSINVDRDGLLPQLEIYHLGGLKTIVGRLTFYVGFFNLVLLVPTAYNSSPTLRAVFPSVFVFASLILLLLGIAMVLEFAVVYPSQIKFNKEQSAKNLRDPIYREVLAVREDLASLHEHQAGDDA